MSDSLSLLTNSSKHSTEASCESNSPSVGSPSSNMQIFQQPVKELENFCKSFLLCNA